MTPAGASRRRRPGAGKAASRAAAAAAGRLPGGCGSGSRGRGRSLQRGGWFVSELRKPFDHAPAVMRWTYAGSMAAARSRRLPSEAARLPGSLPSRSSAARDVADGRRAARRLQQSRCRRSGRKPGAAAGLDAGAACLRLLPRGGRCRGASARVCLRTRHVRGAMLCSQRRACAGAAPARRCRGMVQLPPWRLDTCQATTLLHC